MSDPARPHTSDLASQITLRCEELGLTLDTLAIRANMDPAFLEYVQQSPRAVVSGEALFQLAKALETTPSSLARGDVGRPPGYGRVGPHPVLVTLSREQCESYLLPGGIGRIAFVAERGPIALPVNFRFHSGTVVFRTASTSSVSSALGTIMGFEVDRVDDSVSEGWSVLVTGRAEPVEAGDRATLMRLGIEPWAGGYRDVFVRIGIDEITGRAIRQGRRSAFES